MTTPIYLDHNATTPLMPEVVEAMLPFLREHFGNPSSGHVFGQRAKRAVNQARGQIAGLIGADENEIVFTSGGTEANNLAIHGAGRHGALLTSVIEHPATTQPCDWLAANGRRIERLPVDANGVVSLDHARRALSSSGTFGLVTVMHSHNETGVLQPIGELAVLAHAASALIHTDAAQSVGKVPLKVRELGVDLLSLAGHKLYAPKGVGALFVKRGVTVTPFVRGAGHERGVRPGTENVASIVGLGLACEILGRDLESAATRVGSLRDQLWSQLREGIPDMALNGHPEKRLPNTLNVRFPGVTGESVLAHATELAASTGSACHDGHDTPPAAVIAMGVDPKAAMGSVRLTLGRGTTSEEIGHAASALIAAYRRLLKAA